MINEKSFNEIFKPVAKAELSEAELKSHEDYERGVQDCIDGVKHENQSTAYNEGYGFQYACEQARGASDG